MCVYVCMYACMHVIIHAHAAATHTPHARPATWPLQDILVLRVVCARINCPFILPARLHCPHCCNTIARLLGNIRPPPSNSFLYATHHTILVITISCKGHSRPAAFLPLPARSAGAAQRVNPPKTLPDLPFVCHTPYNIGDNNIV